MRLGSYPWSSPGTWISATAEASSLPRLTRGSRASLPGSTTARRSSSGSGATLGRASWSFVRAFIQMLKVHCCICALRCSVSAQSCSPRVPVPPNARWIHESNISVLSSWGQREEVWVCCAYWGEAASLFWMPTTLLCLCYERPLEMKPWVFLFQASHSDRTWLYCNFKIWPM